MPPGETVRLLDTSMSGPSSWRYWRNQGKRHRTYRPLQRHQTSLQVNPLEVQTVPSASLPNSGHKLF
ncbi:hypothetical protein COCON_G00092120 [Conger conger]|uniref:Uncharacterized protein n=1 Tax=Conger conger TaxID=82655 RepID=A0A9Q1DL77_CONCO|nr:hypothetical protein COCON_G00092120 [Conger conger]